MDDIAPSKEELLWEAAINDAVDRKVTGELTADLLMKVQKACKRISHDFIIDCSICLKQFHMNNLILLPSINRDCFHHYCIDCFKERYKRRPPSLADNLLIHWSLEEETGMRNDRIGNNNLTEIDYEDFGT